MDRSLALAVDFAERRPAAAAAALEELPAGTVSAFLSGIPVHRAAGILGEMTPWSAATFVAALSDERAAALLRDLAFADAARIMRLVPEERRADLFAALPERLGSRLRRSLSFSEHVAGAWADPSHPVLPETRRAEETLDQLRASRRRPSQVIFLTDSTNAYAGLVSLDRLLHAAPDARLSQIADRSVTPLSSLAPVLSARGHAGWDSHPVLPVVDRKDAVVGGLSRPALKRAAAAVSSGALTATGGPSVTAALLDAFLVSMAGLIKVMSGGGETRR